MRMRKQQPFVSIVIASYNRRPLLEKLIKALTQQSYPSEKITVFVCDDGSSDGSVEFLAACNLGIKLVLVEKAEGSNRGPAASRNAAIAKVETEYVLITDDDTVPERNWVESHVNYLLEHPELAGVGGRIVRINNSLIGSYIDHSGAMRHPKKADGTVGYLVTANAAYRSCWINKVNGFNEAITWPGGEDPELAFRIREAGGVLGLNLDATIKHHHRDTISGIAKMFHNHGLGLAASISLGTKLRHTSGLRVFGATLKDGTRRIVTSSLQPSKKLLFLPLNLIRAISFSRGFVHFQKHSARFLTASDKS